MSTTRKRRHRLSVSDRAKKLSGGGSSTGGINNTRRRRQQQSEDMRLIPERLVPRRINKKTRAFTKKDFNSGDGMLTTVWGPSMWHFLHTMSFNYPVEPTPDQKRHYMDFILNLRNILPCKYSLNSV
jgi:hypothetical protein